MGRMGLVLENIRRTQMTCAQAVAMYGSELWWKGELAEHESGRTDASERTAPSTLPPQPSGMTVCATYGIPSRGRPGGTAHRGPDQTSGHMAGGHREVRNNIPAGGHPAQGGRHHLRPRGSEIEAQKPRPGLTLWTEGSRQDSGACGCWKVHLVASLALFWMHKECLFGMNRAVFDYVQGMSVWYEQGCV